MQLGKHPDAMIVPINPHLFKKLWLNWGDEELNKNKPSDSTVHNNQTLLLLDWKPNGIPAPLQSQAATSATKKKKKPASLKNT